MKRVFMSSIMECVRYFGITGTFFVSGGIIILADMQSRFLSRFVRARPARGVVRINEVKGRAEKVFNFVARKDRLKDKTRRVRK